MQSSELSLKRRQIESQNGEMIDKGMRNAQQQGGSQTEMERERDREGGRGRERGSPVRDHEVEESEETAGDGRQPSVGPNGLNQNV